MGMLAFLHLNQRVILQSWCSVFQKSLFARKDTSGSIMSRHLLLKTAPRAWGFILNNLLGRGFIEAVGRQLWLQHEPEVLTRALRRQGIAALHFSDDASNLEGANPLAPPTFLGDKPAQRVHYRKVPGVVFRGYIREVDLPFFIP